jgi:hypothetical protein
MSSLTWPARPYLESSFLSLLASGVYVPSHAICVSFLTLITTEVLGRNLGFDWVQVFVS